MSPQNKCGFPSGKCSHFLSPNDVITHWEVGDNVDDETTIVGWALLWDDLKSLDIDNGTLVDIDVLITDNNVLLVGSRVEDNARLDLEWSETCCKLSTKMEAATKGIL